MIQEDLTMLGIIIIVFAAIFRYMFSMFIPGSSVNIQLPPGKMGLPLLGESLDFLSYVDKGEAENFVFDRISKYSSRVFKTKLLGEDVIVMHGSEENKFLYANTNKLVAEWWPKHVGKLVGVGDTSSGCTYSSSQSRLRDLMQPFVSSKAMHQHVQLMDHMIQRHLQENWHGKHKVLAVPLIKYCNLSMVCRVFLSMEDEDLISKFMGPTQAVAEGFASLPVNLPWTQYGKAMAASRELKRLLIPMIRERRASLLLDLNKSCNNQLDLLTIGLLFKDKNGNQITEEEIANRAIQTLVGAHQSSGTISVMLSRLADHPDIYSRLLHEQMEVASNKAPRDLLNMDDIHKLKYLSNVTREVLRLHTPALFAFREVISDFTYDGRFHIPKGWKILFYIAAIHKDPQYFSNPNKFDPSRFDDIKCDNGDGGLPPPYAFIPFGGGTLVCPGKNIIQLFISVLMYNLVKMFRWEKVIPDEKIIHQPGPVPAQDLPIFLYPH